MNALEQESIVLKKSRLRRSHRGKDKCSKKTNRKLPDRWSKYEAIGRDIPGTRIIAFKTPLNAQYFDNFDNKERFEVKHLLEYCNNAGKDFGLVIDLTNTDRYYNSEIWSENGVEYVKIRCPGHEINRHQHLVDHFINTVKGFFLRNEDNEKLVGVHCTHGLNRTGYVICRYLMECHRWNASKAIEEFEVYRGYKIERKAYIESLYEYDLKKLQNFKIESDVSPLDVTDEETITKAVITSKAHSGVIFTDTAAVVTAPSV